MTQPFGTTAPGPDRIGAGTLLADRYAVLEGVGYGGMSTVYRGRDRLLDREVAIKVMNARLGSDDADRSPFLREARAAAGLAYPGIVGVYDAGIFAGWPYIVMEYVPGGSLKQVIDSEAPLDPARAVSMAIEMAEALQYGHDRGIVHCDVKPQNVLLDGGGHPKLVDFGISQSVAATAALTATVSGTAGYVAPEQLEGASLDGRADVYSLGTVLYQMLTRALPFEAPNVAALATRRLVADPRPIRELNPAVPPTLAAIVMRCLVRDRHDRFASAAELAAVLRAYRDGATEPLTVRRPPAEPRRESTQVWRREEIAAVRAPAPAHRSGPFWALLSVLVALLVALVVALVVILPSRSSGGSVAVPAVQGQRVDAAANTLHAAGLNVKEVVLAQSPEPFGIVIEQRPAPGATLSKHDAVTLMVSGGTQP